MTPDDISTLHKELSNIRAELQKITEAINTIKKTSIEVYTNCDDYYRAYNQYNLAQNPKVQGYPKVIMAYGKK